MHPNPIYRTRSARVNLDFVRAIGFGQLCVNAEPAPLVSHVPFLLDAPGQEIALHLVRSNPIVRLLQTPQVARLVVSGAHGYISPDWYGIEDQVPTWNYVAVHLTGQLELRPQEELRSVLEDLSAHFEAQLAPKPVWTLDKMTPEALARMERQIVPIRMRITEIDGTWKLSQNKPDAARIGAARALAGSGIGAGTAQLSALMQDLPDLSDQ